MSEPLKVESARNRTEIIIAIPVVQKTALVIAVLLSTAGMMKSAYVFSRHLVTIAGANGRFTRPPRTGPQERPLLDKDEHAGGRRISRPVPHRRVLYLGRKGHVRFFKHSPQTDSDNIEWYNRILLINDGKTPVQKGFKMVREIDRSFYNLETAKINEIAKRYSLDYYLGRSDGKRPYRIAYSNDEYTLYFLR